MAQSVRVHRISSRTKDYETKQLAAVRATIAYSKHLLKSSGATDTFAGRKTQEPFPKEREKGKESEQ
jgi:hypothetical protein